MGDDTDLVEIETFAFADAAKVAEGLLKSEGIPCFLRDQGGFPTGAFWAEKTAMLRLMVPAASAEQARELLRSRVSDSALEDQARPEE
jgi:hypothetical protein